MIDIALRRNDDNYSTVRREGAENEAVENSNGDKDSPSSKHSNIETKKNIVHLGHVEYHNTPHSYHLSLATGHQNIFGGGDTIDGNLI